IEARFPVVAPGQIGDVVYELHALDGRLARAEVVAADVEIAAARVDDRFGRVAVGLPRLFVARELEARLVDDVLRQGRSERAAEGVALHEAVARMFFRRERAVILVVDAGEALMVE